MVFAWLIACIVLDAFVILANVLEQFLIIRKWSKLDRIDHLLFSLSISDLISGITTLGIDSWWMSVNLSKNQNISHGTTLAVGKIFDGVFLFSVFASVFHIIAVAIERLFAIQFPRQYYRFTTFGFKCTTISMIWVIALLLTPTFSVVPVLSIQQDVGALIRAITLTITVVLVFFIYVFISYLLFRQRKTVMHDLHSEIGIQNEKLKRLTILCFFLGMSFVICVLPITLSYYHADLYHDVVNFMITLNSLINPCVYFIKLHYDSKTIIRQRSDTTRTILEARNSPMSNVPLIDPSNMNENAS